MVLQLGINNRHICSILSSNKCLLKLQVKIVKCGLDKIVNLQLKIYFSMRPQHNYGIPSVA